MKITSIHVEGFGSLRGRTFDVDSPVTMFYGANEAGKSTLMGFIRAVLFGFPARLSRAERYEPLGGGAHGGALTLLDEQGQSFLVERYDAPSSGGRRASAGLVKVTLSDGSTGGEELLNTLLGGLSADLFRSLFAFGLTELQELRTLQTDELSGYLYSAGLGISGSAIMEAERKLTAQADGLYKPRGRNQEINRLLRELEGLEQTLRRGRDQAADYDRLLEERRSAEGRIAALEQRQEALRAELHKLSLAVKARSGWVRLGQIGRELAALPALESFPEQASAKLDALEEELTRVEEERTRLLIKQQSLHAKLTALDLDSGLLVGQVELNHLLDQAAAYEDNRRSAIELRVEQEHLREQLDRLIGQIDERWTESTLAVFPVSIVLREQVRAFKEQFQAALAEELRARTELEAIRQQKDRLEQNIQSLEMDLHRKGIRTDLTHIDFGNENDGHAALQRLSRDYADWKLLQKDIAHLMERHAEQRRHDMLLDEEAARNQAAFKRNQRKLLGAIAGLTIIAASVLLWKGSWIAALLALVLFTVVISYVYAAGRPNKAKRSQRAQVSLNREDAVASSALQRLEDERRELERSLQDQVRGIRKLHQQADPETAAALNVESALKRGPEEGQFALFPLQELQAQLDVWMQESDLWKQRSHDLRRQMEKLSDAREMLRLQRQQEEEREAEFKQFKTGLSQLQEAWSEWLRAVELHDQLSPDAALETIQVVEQGQPLLRQMHKLKARQETLRESQELYERKTAALLRLSPREQQEPLLALKRWKEQEQRQLSLLIEQQRLETLYSDGEQELLVVYERSSRVEEKLAALYVEASASDGETLRKSEREQAERSKLIHEQKALEGSLESLLGRRLHADFVELLESQGEDELVQSIHALEAKLLESVEEANLLRQEIGRLSGAIEKLEQGTEHTDRLLGAEALRTSIGQLTDQYAAAAFASLLMKKAREVYEQERQPGVLLRSSSYFEQMTEGLFKQVKAPFGEQRLVAVRANGQSMDTNQLSRGTAEQLYLAMRFALAEEYAGKAVLPLVLDDIFVNFDQKRMESCLRVISDISKCHQVLLFTCHPHVRDAAERLIAGNRLIEL